MARYITDNGVITVDKTQYHIFELNAVKSSMLYLLSKGLLDNPNLNTAKCLNGIIQKANKFFDLDIKVRFNSAVFETRSVAMTGVVDTITFKGYMRVKDITESKLVTQLAQLETLLAVMADDLMTAWFEEMKDEFLHES